MTVPLALIGAYLWGKGKGAFPYLFGAAGFFPGYRTVDPPNIEAD